MFSERSDNPALPVLTARSLTKSYGRTAALASVDFELLAGEVHALVGENGAGKSTLIKILSGATVPDHGAVEISGHGYHDPIGARDLGLRTIYQDRTLVDALTVAENLFLGALPRGRAGIPWRKVRLAARDALMDLAPEVDPQAIVGDLGPAAKQLVEIARAVIAEPRILILDEPTASLTAGESERLLQLLRRLVSQRALGVIYISHHLDEVKAIADRVTVLRDGARVGTWLNEDLPLADMVRAMVGRTVDVARPAGDADVGEVVLKVRGLERHGFPGVLDFDVHAGEIVGIAGATGTGRTEVLEVVFGVQPRRAGEIYLEGQPVEFRHPQEATRAGVALVPEDRLRQGLIDVFDLTENVTFAATQRSTSRMIKRAGQQATAERLIGQLRIRTAGPRVWMSSLSGGNQQKVAIAKWLTVDAALMMFDEPTAGVDIGAKAEVHAIMRDLARTGKALLVVSSDLAELEVVADRILVLHRHGSLTEFLPPLDHSRLLSAVTSAA